MSVSPGFPMLAVIYSYGHHNHIKITFSSLQLCVKFQSLVGYGLESVLQAGGDLT